MRVLTRYGLFVIITLASALAVAACGHAPTSTTSLGGNPAADGFVPGLGEIMSLQQMRHTKLCLAGQAGNWKLAEYEVEELGEGFDDVVKLHPTHKDSPVDPKDAIPRMISVPLEDCRHAIETQNAAVFAAAYDALTTACNNCHEATNFGFNRVQRPTSNPYPNQVFEPARR